MKDALVQVPYIQAGHLPYKTLLCSVSCSFDLLQKKKLVKYLLSEKKNCLHLSGWEGRYNLECYPEIIKEHLAKKKFKILYRGCLQSVVTL